MTNKPRIIQESHDSYQFIHSFSSCVSIDPLSFLKGILFSIYIRKLYKQIYTQEGDIENIPIFIYDILK